MIRFGARKRPIFGISLDLDDTLWPIAPTMLRAEQTLHNWLERHHPSVAAAFPIPAMRALRERVWHEHPHLQHDFTTTRMMSLRQAMLPLGANEADVEQAFALFFTARNQVTLFDGVIERLERLQRLVPIVALTNGNADLTRIGIAGYFRAQVNARSFGLAKPAAEIFWAAAKAINVDPEHVLHIGDHAEQDVQGAVGAGLCAAGKRLTGGDGAIRHHG